MSYRRRNNGEETRSRLLEWSKGQTAAERLSSHILYIDGYKSIDPSHPLGGRDGKKDMICIKNDIEWIGACYFPRGKKEFSVIKRKFLSDLEGVKGNRVEGIAFITNQAITLSQRKELKYLSQTNVDIFHLERIVNLLNSPHSYGARQDFLDINMTDEEKVSFMYYYKKQLEELSNKLTNIKLDQKTYNNYRFFDPNMGSGGMILSSTVGSFPPIEQQENLDAKFLNYKKLFKNEVSKIKLNSKPLDIRERVQYDVLITNPPYNFKKNVNSSFQDNSNLISAQLRILDQAIHCLKLNEQSRVALILGDEVLENKKGESVRKRLIEMCNLDTIVRLPLLNKSGLNEKTNLVIFHCENDPRDNVNPVWIYNLRRGASENNQPMGLLIEKFLEAFYLKDSKDINWTIVSKEEIRSKGYNLNLQ